MLTENGKVVVNELVDEYKKWFDENN